MPFKKGKSNPAYIDGRTNKKYYCKNCYKEICLQTVLKGTGLCGSCSNKIHSKGKKNGNYIDGRTTKKYYCKVCGKKISTNYALYHTSVCARCAKVGNKNANWCGGITLLRKQIRDCFKSRQWRSDILTRDNFTCQKCGQHGGKLEVHHTPKTFAIIIKEYKIKTLQDALDCEELWNINNGITLCKKCHHKVFKRSK